MFAVHLNGVPATAEDLAPLAFAGYAHYTSMQVRDRAVRGLDLHLVRLRDASAELFGIAPDPDRLRGFLRAAAAAGPPDASLVATLFSGDRDAVLRGEAVEPDVLVRTSPPVVVDAARSMRLRTVPFERVLPHLKNVATLGQTYFPRQVAVDGFDDVLFIDNHGNVSESSIWNVAFWDGTTVIWPEAAMLRGVTMSLVADGLEREGVPQLTRPVRVEQLALFTALALMNSWTPAVRVTAVDGMVFPGDERFVTVLNSAFASQPADPL
jgi:branched-subunit amino acid aminotransferase/4-amino-4-deoxychorismate lyase